MTKEITISTRVTEEMAEQVDRLSEQIGRTRAWILHEALQAYVASEQEFIDAVQEGLNDLAQGNVVDHDRVVADWSRRRNESGQ
ncbi:CopG family ribbon-helix-helix protein [Pseudanabaena sp. PCC 6802]|uniref:CopG family ribbon-helix-helix protein n=1 Tax=Pseudanabaena sp. PCC 6802 TaxID=118173 RepID=UPI0003483F27|nr:ribbon-helix-helix protein, CopG family [Pseudanabaena sp. PCC 6802]